MKIYRDGTLPRITSSSRGAKRYLRIVKNMGDEAKKHPYDLIWIGPPSDESESEASEEEPWSDDDIPNIQVPEVNMPDIQLPEVNIPDIQLPEVKIPDIQLPVENKEKAEDVESQTEVKTKINKPENKQSTNRHTRYRSPYKQNNYKFSYKRKFNTSGRLHRNYDNSNASTTHNDERSYKYPNKDFGASKSFERSYNSNSDHINPWVEPPTSIILNTGLPFQYQAYSYGPVSVLDQTPPHCTAESSIKPIGLLGDKPHPSHSHNYVQNRQNNNFVGNPNYWNNTEYNEYSPNDYQRRPSHVNARMSMPPHYKNCYQRKYRGNHKNRNNVWKKKTMNNSGHFDYRK